MFDITSNIYKLSRQMISFKKKNLLMILFSRRYHNTAIYVEDENTLSERIHDKVKIMIPLLYNAVGSCAFSFIISRFSFNVIIRLDLKNLIFSKFIYT